MALPLNYFRQSKQTGRHIATSKTYRQIICHVEIHYSGLISEKNVLFILPIYKYQSMPRRRKMAIIMA